MRLTERKCNGCGMTRLLSRLQAKESRRARRHADQSPSLGRDEPHSEVDVNQRENAAPFVPIIRSYDSHNAEAGVEGIMAGEAAGRALAPCPKCGSTDFTDRKVTRKNPASAGASRAQLV